ncbi:hypothetical protein [Streptomyces hebeiensis]
MDLVVIKCTMDGTTQIVMEDDWDLLKVALVSNPSTNHLDVNEEEWNHKRVWGLLKDGSTVFTGNFMYSYFSQDHHRVIHRDYFLAFSGEVCDIRDIK